MDDQRSEVFVGRTDELAVVQRCASDAESGRPWVIVVTGDAGTGKSAFVRQAVRRLEGFSIVAAAGDALAVDESMWLVRQLIATLDPETTPFTAGLHVLAALGERQADGPVAVIVEDLHWGDGASRRTLLTALRRLEGDRVLAIVTTRPDPGTDDDWIRLVEDQERCRHVRLGALSATEVASIADGLGLPLGPNAAVRLQRHTAGHALYVRTLLHELSPVQLNALGALPAPRSLALATVAGVAELPPSSVELLRALAVVGRPSGLVSVGRVANVADPTSALDGALPSGFVEWSPSDPESIIRFAHPLYATAVYDDIPPLRRRELHLAAAEVDPGASLSHRIAATDRADDSLAAELEQAAVVTADLGVAARYLSAAAEFSVTPHEATSRLIAAGRRWLELGDVPALARLRQRLEACPVTSERDLLLGWLAWQTGQLELAEQLLRHAADVAATDDETAAALLQLGSLYTVESRGRDAIRVGRALLELSELDPLDEDLAWWTIASGVNQAEGGIAGLAVLDERYAGSTDPDGVSAEVQWRYAAFAHCAGRPAAALTWFDRLMPRVRAGALVRDLPHIHMIRARCHYRVGEWDEALLHAHTAIDLANDDAQAWIRGHVNAVAASIHAGRGQWDLAERRLAYAQAATDATPIWAATVLTRAAEAFIARARGDPATVVALLSPQTADHEAVAPGASNLAYWPALVHALIDLGRLEDARREAEHLRAAAQRRQIDLRMVLLTVEARLLAAAGSAAEASATFDAAIAAIVVDSDVMEQIALRHAYGRHLRASGRRREALVQLAAAHTLASRLGAAPYAERINVDLRGEEARSLTPAADDPLITLTSRERDVVTLVAGGATNREAASALYVSVKSVEFHLGNVYAKLHIESRRQLKSLVVRSASH